MKSRGLLKEIPIGKFHSAIFTTYSINLYYLEQQVLPLLGAKDIHYVSILADGAMLSSQLENFSFLSQQRKRNYAINGIQSNGAFHPKLIFLAGPNSVLLLVGSGNLTSSGHGKNLEVWNSVYVNSSDDSKYGFAINAWNYIKQLHIDLGESAINKLKSIEENCLLLSRDVFVEAASTYDLDRRNQISFHVNQISNSLFSQVSDIIGNDIIKRITIMCPFHDSEGKFIKELNKRYSPNNIDVLVQSNFGSLPFKMSKQSNVRYFDWSNVMLEMHNQSYFHAKNIVFHGKNKNYLISGSANASIAAFGTLKIPATNHESCVVYQSTSLDYLKLLAIKVKGKSVDIKDYESDNNLNTLEPSGFKHPVFIKSAEKNFDSINLILQANYLIEKGYIQLFDAKGILQFKGMVSLYSGENLHQISIPHGISLLFAQMSINGKDASNKQFIIDINAFESTNPSPRNRSLNQIRKLIESGNFSTPKIIDYLNTIYRQKEAKNEITKTGLQVERNMDLPKEDDDKLIYLSYKEIQERAKLIDNQEEIHHYIEYKGVRLWESIFSYLKENRENELQAKIDEEETEDINNSGGRLDNREPKAKRSISKSNFERLKVKVVSFLDSYNVILEQKTTGSTTEQPSLIDLSMYLIMLEILLHLVGHKESINEDNNEKHLLQIPFSKIDYAWSEYLIRYVGMFTMWCTQKNGFKDIESIDYRQKLEHYKSMAFKTSLSALSIHNIINKGYDSELQKQWLTLSLLNSNLVFNTGNIRHYDTEEFISFIPQNVLEDIGDALLEDEISKNLTELDSIKTKKSNYSVGDFFFHPEIGYTYLGRVIENSSNTFYKLFTPSFDWDDDVNNYWNGHVYSIKEKRWLRSKKENLFFD